MTNRERIVFELQKLIKAVNKSDNTTIYHSVFCNDCRDDCYIASYEECPFFKSNNCDKIMLDDMEEEL